jgi:hypothetical protein
MLFQEKLTKNLHILLAEHPIPFSDRVKPIQENLMTGVPVRPMTHIKRLINNQKGLGKIIVTMNLLVVGNNTQPPHELNSITLQAETTIINRVMNTDTSPLHHPLVVIIVTSPTV